MDLRGKMKQSKKLWVIIELNSSNKPIKSLIYDDKNIAYICFSAFDDGSNYIKRFRMVEFEIDI